MLDLFLKLIEKLIQWRKAREEDARKLFTDFVAPALADFDVIHKGYLATFAEIRDRIATARRKRDIPKLKSDLMNYLRVASRMAESDRLKLRQLESFAAESELGPFIRAVVRYMEFDHDSAHVIVAMNRRRGPRNVVRDVVLPEVLVSSFGENDTLAEQKRLALFELESRLEQLQLNYGVVIDEVIKLKHKLLSPAVKKK